MEQSWQGSKERAHFRLISMHGINAARRLSQDLSGVRVRCSRVTLRRESRLVPGWQGQLGSVLFLPEGQHSVSRNCRHDHQGGATIQQDR